MKKALSTRKTTWDDQQTYCYESVSPGFSEKITAGKDGVTTEHPLSFILVFTCNAQRTTRISA